jgi:hypothetical protein
LFGLRPNIPWHIDTRDCRGIYLFVRYHVDWCTKNKRMFRILARGLFLTCTKNLFFYQAHTIHVITYAGYIFTYEKERKEKTLTWKGSLLIMVANPHSCWFLALSQVTYPLLLSRVQYFFYYKYVARYTNVDHWKI